MAVVISFSILAGVVVLVIVAVMLVSKEIYYAKPMDELIRL